MRSLMNGLRVLMLMGLTVASAQDRQLLVGGCGLGRIMLLNSDNTIAWEMEEPREVSDLWMLPNSNIVHSTKDGFQEIKPDYDSGSGAKIVWRVDAPAGSECHACQPVGEDRFLVGFSSKERSYLAEVDSRGKEHKVIAVDGQSGKHSSFRQVRKTAEATYLTSQQCKGGRAREYNADGTLKHTFVSGRFAGKRLANGHTLLSCGDEHRLIEVDADGEIVWEFNQSDVPGIKIGFIAAFEVLGNGNILFTNWGGHGGSTGGAVLEITRDKKIVFSTGSAVKNRVSSLFVVSR